MPPIQTIPLDSYSATKTDGEMPEIPLDSYTATRTGDNIDELPEIPLDSYKATKTDPTEIELDGFLDTLGSSVFGTLSSDIANEIGNITSGLGSQVMNAVNGMVDVASNFPIDGLSGLGDFFSGFAESFLNVGLSSLVSNILSIANVEGFIKFIFGAIQAPLTILSNIINTFWDTLTAFITLSVLAGDFFFNSINEIPKEAITSSFTDIRKGVLPGTLYSRPLTKHPLFPSEPDVHRVARNDPTVYEPGGMKYNYDAQRDPLLDEPPMNYNPTYPYNHYLESESGHIFEFDDTPSFERTQIRHRSGTGMHVNPNGAKKSVVVGTNFMVVVRDNRAHIYGNGELFIDKEARVSINGNALIKVAKDAKISVGRDCNIDVKDNLKLTAGKNVDIDAGGDMNLHTNGAMNLSSGGIMNLASSGNMDLYTEGAFVAQSLGNMDILSTATLNMNSASGTFIQSHALAWRIAPDIQDFETSGGAFNVSGTVHGATKELIQEPHEFGKAFNHEKFELDYEGYPIGGGSRIDSGDVKSSMRNGSLNNEEWTQRQPDMVLPNETDETGTPSQSPRDGEGVSATPTGNLRNPANPIYDLKISKHIYLSDVTTEAVYSHYLQPQCSHSVEQIIKNLSRVAIVALDPFYERFGGLVTKTRGRPRGRLQINSGFRPPNPKKPCSSWHEKGCAVDIQIPSIGDGYVIDEAVWAKENLVGWDHILLEFQKGAWLHLGVVPGRARGRTQTFNHQTVYHASKFVNLRAKRK